MCSDSSTKPAQATRGKRLLETLRQTRPDPVEAQATGDIPLSLAQQTLLASQELHQDQAVGNITHAWDLHGPLDAAALERAFARLVQRHDALRMSITRDHGRPVAHFADHLDSPLPCETPADDAPAQRLQEVDAQIEQASLSSLPLTGDRLWQARLFRVAEDHHIFAMVMHHLICDDWSWRILLRDLFAFYQGEIGQTESELPRVSSFKSYLAGLYTENAVDAGTAWPEIDWPTTHSGLTERQALCPASVQAQLPAEAFTALQQVARVHGCTPFTFFLTSYQLLLSLYCDQAELGISSSVADRSASGAQQSLGALVRDIQVGASLSGHKTFADLLHACNASLRVAQNKPDDQINLGRATIGYYNAPELEIAAGGIEIRERPAPVGVTSINLHLDLEPGADGVRILLKGQARHFDRTQLDSLITCYQRILDQVIRTPAMSLDEIALITSEEVAAQAARSIALAPLPDSDAVDSFTTVAQTHPDAIALETPTCAQSYRALDEETNAWAHWLRAQGLDEGKRIGVFAPRGTVVFKAWMAALKAGLVVVPMDFDLTEARLGDMLREAGCDWVIGPASGTRVGNPGQVTFLTPPGAAELAGQPTTAIARQNTDPRRDAFVMFTSGTTGTPKSIPICHQAVMRLALDTPHLPVGPGDRMIQLASPGFDGSFIELWGAWLNGATLVLCEKPILAEGGLAVEFRKLAPTASFMTTSLFNTMVDAGPCLLAPLKYLAIGGEAASPSHCRRALEAHPDLVLSNAYGPTENTGLTTSYRVPPGDPGTSVPIGRPLPNNVALVLSRFLTPVPDGFAGELLVGGPGLARGYENQPDLSRKRFQHHPAAAFGLPMDGPVTLYHTGDRTRWTPAGEIEFLGRRDTQFKLHGYRIEPTEIEAALMEHPTVGRAGVIPDHLPGQDRAIGILAYVETAAGAALDETALRSFLSTRLPRPHRPTRYIQLTSIPLTRNGKTDTRALSELLQRAADHQTTRPAAQDRLTAIWQRLLGLGDIPEDVDFYALGGTSLSLVRMVLEVEETFETEIDFAEISEEPTLARLRFLVSLSPAPNRTNLRHLRLLKQGDPDLPPLILMPSVSGAAAWAVDLVAQMAAPNEVLALSFDPGAGAAPESARFGGMLTAFLDDIRTHVGDRPVVLSGYSFGGALTAYLAGLAHTRGVNVARIINLDGGCPTSWLTPKEDGPEGPGGLFDAEFRLHPVTALDVPMHLVTTKRGFPLSRPGLCASWARLATQDIIEHAADTHHALLPKPPFAQVLAGVLDRILADDMPATRTHGAAFDPAEVALLNDIKSLARDGRFDDAQTRLTEAQAARSAQGALPEWMALGEIQLARFTGDTDRLKRLRRTLPAQAPSTAVLHALLKQSGPAWLPLLTQAYTASGPDLSGAVPLIGRYLETGHHDEAATIIARLEASPLHHVEAALARALRIAFCDGFAPAIQPLTEALTGAEVDHTHIRWGAEFLAKHGYLEAGLDLLELERNRFPGPMQKARAQIERRFRSRAIAPEGSQVPPVEQARAPSRPLKRLWKALRQR